jgi:hypothetical protein
MAGDDQFFPSAHPFSFPFSIRPNARDCTLKSKDLDSVVRNALVLVADMRRKWEIVSEQLWMVGMRQFSFSLSEVSL